MTATRTPTTPHDPRHGTNAGYNAGCRDACCKAAHAAWRREYRKELYLRGQVRLIDATGTRRRVQALMAIGHSEAALCRAIGHCDGYLFEAMKVRRVRPATHKLIEQLYDQLCMVVPTGGWADRARRHAARAGYAPPLAWDDDTIDDPKARPDRGPRSSRLDTDVDEAVVLRILNGDASVARTATAAERVETARRWVASRRPLSDLGRLTGWRPDRYAHIGSHADEGAA